MFRNIIVQLFIFAIIFFGFSWFKESTMLKQGQPLASAAILLPDLAHNQVQLSPVNKPTILYFFAPWCQICDFSIGNLEEIKQNNPSLNVIAVALDYHTSEQIHSYAEKHQLTMPVVLGNTLTKSQFNITAYPSYYVINPNNEVVARSMGYSTEFGLYLRTLAI